MQLHNEEETQYFHKNTQPSIRSFGCLVKTVVYYDRFIPEARGERWGMFGSISRGWHFRQIYKIWEVYNSSIFTCSTPLLLVASGFFLLDFLVPLFAPPPFCIFLRQHVKRKLFFFMSSLYLLYLLHLFAVGAAEELALPGTCLLSLRSKRCPCRSDEADPKRCLTELSLLWMPVTISSFYYLGGGLAAPSP